MPHPKAVRRDRATATSMTCQSMAMPAISGKSAGPQACHAARPNTAQPKPAGPPTRATPAGSKRPGLLEQLTHKPSARRTKREPDGELGLPAGCSHQEQVGQIDAANDEQYTNG